MVRFLSCFSLCLYFQFQYRSVWTYLFSEGIYRMFLGKKCIDLLCSLLKNMNGKVLMRKYEDCSIEMLLGAISFLKSTNLEKVSVNIKT